MDDSEKDSKQAKSAEYLLATFDLLKDKSAKHETRKAKRDNQFQVLTKAKDKNAKHETRNVKRDNQFQALTEVREVFEIKRRNFEFVRDLICRQAGIQLSDMKTAMVYNRLLKRCRALHLSNVDEYIDRLRCNSDPEEIGHFVNALTTNVTSFFRENYQFEELKNVLLARLPLPTIQRPWQMWSAGCSTGEEAYSLAIVLHSSGYGMDKVRILASDLDSNVLVVARLGIYPEDRVNESVSPNFRSRYFHSVQSGKTQIEDDIRRMIVDFRCINLIGLWEPMPDFDIILCRNVMIYFSPEVKKELFLRFWDQLRPGGYLFLGHAETILPGEVPFKYIGKGIYQRI